MRLVINFLVLMAYLSLFNKHIQCTKPMLIAVETTVNPCKTCSMKLRNIHNALCDLKYVDFPIIDYLACGKQVVKQFFSTQSFA